MTVHLRKYLIHPVIQRGFGPVFITEEAYDEFKASGKAQKSEDYLYSYKLGNGKTDKDLKDYLKDLKIELNSG
jgi:hypothetical protein